MLLRPQRMFTNAANNIYNMSLRWYIYDFFSNWYKIEYTDLAQVPL